MSANFFRRFCVLSVSARKGVEEVSAIHSDPVVVSPVHPQIDIFVKSEIIIENLDLLNRQVVIKAVSQNGNLLRFISDEHRADVNVVLAALRRNPWAWEYALEPAKSSEAVINFFVDFVSEDLRLINQLPGLEKEVWTILVNRSELSNFFTTSELKTKQTLEKALYARFNILFIDRFRTISDIVEVIGNRQSSNPAKRTAVIIAPTEDWNRAFEVYPYINRLIELGYSVSYYETADENEMLDSLESATEYGHNPANLLILAGHGVHSNLALGSVDCALSNCADSSVTEKFYIDVGDFEPVDQFNLSRFVKIYGDLVLYSCSNGFGGKYYNGNLANTIARTMPRGVKIHSSMVPMNIGEIDLDEHGHISFIWNTGMPYQTDGMKSQFRQIVERVRDVKDIRALFFLGLMALSH